MLMNEVNNASDLLQVVSSAAVIFRVMVPIAWEGFKANHPDVFGDETEEQTCDQEDEQKK